jgi:hypothetical protein
MATGKCSRMLSAILLTPFLAVINMVVSFFALPGGLFIPANNIMQVK